MKVLVTGAGGQLGRELIHTAPPAVEVRGVRHAELDIGRREDTLVAVCRMGPDVIINAAAYTAVDRAEDEPEVAHAANALGPAHLAEAASETGARLIHVSTDFVFGGSQCRPYRPEDAPEPLSVYGRSKLAGERHVLDAPCAGLVVRTSWVYARGGRNFVNTMLRLMAERDEVRVVADQFGAPTWARGLARALWSLVLGHPDLRGVLHYCDAGSASWYDFAVAIAEEGRASGHLERHAVVRPIPTEAYPLPAPRPRFSVLDASRTWQLLAEQPVHWRVRLRQMFQEPEAR